MKTCSTCKKKKDEKEFCNNGGGRLRARCRECDKAPHKIANAKWIESYPEKRQAAHKKYYAGNKEKHKACVVACRKKDYARNPKKFLIRNRQWLYGITEKQWQAMFRKQGGACALCRKIFVKTPHVDHCHDTGKIRGLLCMNCNLSLGTLGDTAEALQKVVQYLQK